MRPNTAIRELFYNYPTKHWHFEQLIKEAGLSRAQTNEWLKKLLQENMIVRTKPERKMPYFTANYRHPHYQNCKRLYALEKMQESGLLDYLASLEKAEMVAVFGSFSRWDWHESSDVDIFIYGKVKEAYVGKFGAKLKREIQVFHGRNKKDLKKMGSALLRNIIKGITIKGSISEEMIKYAAI